MGYGALGELRGCRAGGVAAALAVVCAGWVYFLRGSFCSAVRDFRQPLPGSLRLLSAYIQQRLRRKRGHLKTEKSPGELLLTLINCRYEVVSLRRYCSTVGYGWDYPYSTFRDIPLLYPQFLCSRLISMITCSDRFGLSPYGLVCVSERVKLLQPVDELKRGKFSLRVGVAGYRCVSGGVEVDLALSMRTVHQQEEEENGWSSTITLLSPNTTHTHTLQPDTHTADGADAVRAPLSLTVCYAQPLRLPKTVTVTIKENTGSSHSSAPTPGSAPGGSDYSFNLEDHSTHTLLLTGHIHRL
ncbi:uncharacterized protein si:ch211-12e13.1 isoform X2 [Astyanax mexicanus]|uniref:uncharacterized protein si:ch211-12e13.1 isoform X2 n=1 Tax=Astyanax mexicanus TaxID=7994 RepID=UPI0020CB349B|nr:uncharacterized protein si:ch211-12e13.1 isoform X2 [Astyanax mexicanus]